MTLPEPRRQRWQPMRLGLIELYHYDVEEFRFRDGHLLLRGNNGTGKSKVLSLTLPFLVDAYLTPARVEPDGDRNKRMEWNLLMGGRYDRRTGYTWIEFGRRDAAGQPHVFTFGCGLRAVSGRTGIDSWFFVTDQRIGEDLWLTTPERTVLSRERLMEAIGTRGQVFKTAQDYRRAVDERLFRLGSERYAALVDTLIQLRQPQLSKQPNEQRLSGALTEALAPLDRAALESVAEAMGQLEDSRRELEELDAMRAAVASFGNRYQRYAQVATRRKARVLRQAQTEYDQASRELNAATRALERAEEKVRHWREQQDYLDDQLAAGRARLEVLQSDPVMRDAGRIADAREMVAKCREAEQEAATRLEALRVRYKEESQSTKGRQRDADATRTELMATRNQAADHAQSAGITNDHAGLEDGVDWPDGVAAVPSEFAETLRHRVRDIANRRQEQIDVVRSRRRELDDAEQQRAHARTARDNCADAFDEAAERVKDCTEAFRQLAAEAGEAWREHTRTLSTLSLRETEGLMSDLEVWLGTLNGKNPLPVALQAARDTLERELAAQEAALAAEHRQLDTEVEQLRDEQAALERGVDQPPPVPYVRAADARDGRAGAPLWKVIDFTTEVDDAERAGLEAALEAAGLLDAWLLPQGVLVDPRTHDVLLVPRTECATSLATRLVPAIPEDAPDLTPSAVTAVLRSIALSEQEPIDAETWVSPRGQFRVGAARGAWLKPKAEFIGHTAREAARLARLAAITARLTELETALSVCDTNRAACEATRRAADDELDAAPSDDPLMSADADRSAAERQRRAAQIRLGEADNRLSAAEQAHTRARERLTQDARDLHLPSDADGIERVERALIDYRTAANDFSNAVRNHRHALIELTGQERRERQTGEEVEAAAENYAGKVTAHREAEEKAATLQKTVGTQVDELLAEIEATKSALSRDDRAFKDARAQLNAASAHRGTAQAERMTKESRLAERGETRKAAIAALQTFTADTELLEIALPEEPELPAMPWGIDAALTIARRAEQALGSIPAEDADWARVQSEIGHDLTELQNAMSARGHSATAEPSDHGLIVRIVHQQRPVRPDVLRRQIDAELTERKLLLTARERAVLEEHLEKEVAANLQHMIQETERRVASINKELGERPTSTGVRYRLVWEPVPEDSQDGVPGLAEARKRLLKTSADAWSADDRRQVGEFLQARIAAEIDSDDSGTLFDNLARALDYRKWHRFRVQRFQDGQWRPLTGPASSGERALGLTVPLFAACSSHYESADPLAPRLVLLDEAFAGIDDEARASCMALIRQFDLDFVMTSEREWGCYPDLPGLSICQLVRREGVDAVFISRWTWDGMARRRSDEPIRRFPDEIVDVAAADLAAKMSASTSEV